MFCGWYVLLLLLVLLLLVLMLLVLLLIVMLLRCLLRHAACSSAVEQVGKPVTCDPSFGGGAYSEHVQVWRTCVSGGFGQIKVFFCRAFRAASRRS